MLFLVGGQAMTGFSWSGLEHVEGWVTRARGSFLNGVTGMKIGILPAAELVPVAESLLAP